MSTLQIGWAHCIDGVSSSPNGEKGYDYILRPLTKGGPAPAENEFPIYAGDWMEDPALSDSVMRFADGHCQDCIVVSVTFNPCEGWEWEMNCCCVDDDVKERTFADLNAKYHDHDALTDQSSNQEAD